MDICRVMSTGWNRSPLRLLQTLSRGGKSERSSDANVVFCIDVSATVCPDTLTTAIPLNNPHMLPIVQHTMQTIFICPLSTAKKSGRLNLR